MDGFRAIARIEPADGSHGTGFLISDRLVLTAFHVVADRAQSRTQRTPVWRKGPLVLTFGFPDEAATVWQPAATRTRDDLFSIEHDWAVLELDAAAPADAVPFQLARNTTVGAGFETFGYPSAKKAIGDVYFGTVTAWLDGVGTVDAANLLATSTGGEDAGGISGAPCVVDKRVVGIFLRSFGTARTGQAVARTLYVLPIDRAVEGWKGLVDWDPGDRVVFQDIVERKLPSDVDRLRDAATTLGLPAMTQRSAIARRMLASPLARARAAILQCDLEPPASGPILDRVAAMRLHPDAVAAIRAADRVPIVGSEEERIHRWYVQRAFHDCPPSINGWTIVILHQPGHQSEQAPGSGTSVEQYVARARGILAKRKLAPALIDDLLRDALVPDNEWWLVVIGENRPDVVAALRARLPNARLILGLKDVAPFPAPDEALAIPVSPVMSVEAQRELLASWRKEQATLGIPTDEGEP